MKNTPDHKELLTRLINDGQRAYRLKKGINSCPTFESSVYIYAWKAGYKSAMHKHTVKETLKKCFFNLDM